MLLLLLLLLLQGGGSVISCRWASETELKIGLGRRLLSHRAESAVLFLTSEHTHTHKKGEGEGEGGRGMEINTCIHLPASFKAKDVFV